MSTISPTRIEGQDRPRRRRRWPLLARVSGPRPASRPTAVEAIAIMVLLVGWRQDGDG